MSHARVRTFLARVMSSRLRRACGASCPEITSCSVSACKAYTPSWSEERDVLAWGGLLAPPILADCAWGRAGTGCGISHGGIGGAGRSVVAGTGGKVCICVKGKEAKAPPGSGGLACPSPIAQPGEGRHSV